MLRPTVLLLGFLCAARGGEPLPKPPGGTTEGGAFLADAFVRSLADRAHGEVWSPRQEGQALGRRRIARAIDLGRDYLVASLKEDGQFRYEVNASSGQEAETDNPVRQAGALWSLALLYQRQPSARLREALQRGLARFATCAVPGPGSSGGRGLLYPGSQRVVTGTVALVGLALVDYLRACPDLPSEQRADLLARLDQHLAYLEAVRRSDGHFHPTWDPKTGQMGNAISPYYDGEALLCLAKAAKYLGRTEHLDNVQASALWFAQDYCEPLLEGETRLDFLKQFYQWGSMAFWEIQDAGWARPEVLRDAILVMAHWQVHDLRVLDSPYNQGHALEGLAHAWRAAGTAANPEAAACLEGVCVRLAERLCTLQVRGTRGPGLGAFRRKAGAPQLRIDVTQHAVHGLLLAMAGGRPVPGAR